MFGLWEILIIISVLGYLTYSYVTQANAKRIQQSRRDAEDLIDLDENSFEVLDDDA